MFSPGEARCDRWQESGPCGADTRRSTRPQAPRPRKRSPRCEDLLKPLSMLETFRAYPGEAMMSALKEALARE